MSDKQDRSKPDPLAARKTLTFEQAEGLVSLPSQLARGQISKEFRAALWAALYSDFISPYYLSGDYELNDPWETVLKDAHIHRYHRPVDEFFKRGAVEDLKQTILYGSWHDVLGWLEFTLKHRACPDDFADAIAAIMAGCRLAYAVFDRQVICPIASDAERQTLERAFADLEASEFRGARAHLRNAATELTVGNFADSVRESIHAVESVAEMLEPSGNLAKALGKLEGSAAIHGGMKKAFLALYGYTSDEQGIRHALHESGAPVVDETDALFMIGACASFVSYLINKARSAGLSLNLPDSKLA
jgi:hypothetical protein